MYVASILLLALLIPHASVLTMYLLRVRTFISHLVSFSTSLHVSVYVRVHVFIYGYVRACVGALSQK